MQKILVTVAMMFVVSLGQIAGQTTKTETQSQNRNGKTETYTTTETTSANGRTITTTTHTSTVNMKASFGVKANANMSNFIIRNMDDYQSNMKLGVSPGVFLKLESKHFVLQYELLLHYKSSEMENKSAQTTTDYKYWGLELPIYCMGKINAGSGQVLLGAGPYVGLGLDATQTPGNVDLYKKGETINKATMHRWDFGLGVMVGYEFGVGISVNASYQAGLINTLSAEKDKMTMRNQTVSLGVGYRFSAYRNDRQ